MAQVQRGLASIMNTKGGTMKLRLSPEHLGQVNIQLVTKNGHVSIKIDAETDQARSMLKDGLEGLRSAMESRGVQVDDLSIEGRQRTEFERLFGDAHQSNTQQRGSSEQHESNNHPDQSAHTNDDAQAADTDQHDSNTPRGIWTELGLDAIA